MEGISAIRPGGRSAPERKDQPDRAGSWRTGDPVDTLQRLIELARTDDLERYTVARELIALRRAGEEDWPVIGMFSEAPALPTRCSTADKIYPRGFPWRGARDYVLRAADEEPPDQGEFPSA
jgi:hypothetical protein